MNRQEKAGVIQSLNENILASKATFLVEYQGINVEQLQKLRKNLRVQGGDLKVAKARLMKRAISNTQADVLDPLLKDQIALVFARTDIASIAKVLRDFSKEVEACKIVGGNLGNSLLDAASVLQIAQLPSREVLLAQLMGLMLAPMTQCVQVLNVLIVRLLWTLKQIEATKQQS